MVDVEGFEWKVRMEVVVWILSMVVIMVVWNGDSDDEGG
ncbi:hypothetical protein L195_g062572, partial [Trifolium pratense]